MVQTFLFSAGGLRCAMPLTLIKSVIQMIAMSPAGSAPRSMAGTINLHGRTIPVYAMGELLGMPGHSPRISDMLLIACTGSETIALWIDGIRSVDELLLSSPGEKTGESDVISIPGLVITPAGVVLITDLALFLAHPLEKSGRDALWALRRAEVHPLASEGILQDHNTVNAILNERAAKMLPPEPGSQVSEMTEVLRFQLAYRQFAIEMKFVREVILTGEITPVPGTPDFISGICAARGQIISLVDLRALLEIPEKGLTDLNRVIVITDGKITFGILADNISGAGSVSLDQIAQPHSTELPGSHRYLKGILNQDIFILDAKKILEDPGIIVEDA
ncbi:MAG TPA: chemotaxis protein CheW [Methanoregula sp.]|nr:chemotaxis protein CheW [Methanoregula sp.]